MWNPWWRTWAPAPVLTPIPCTINTSKSSSGNRSSGGPFSEVFTVLYTNLYGRGTCSLEVHQKGVADRVEEVRVKLLDRAGYNDVVDAEAVAIRDATSGGISCWMTVRRSNLSPRKGVKHFWSGEHCTTEGIPYYSPLRDGMFAMDKLIVDDPRLDKVDIRHKYTSDESDGGVRFRVKIRPDPAHHNGLVINMVGPEPQNSDNIYEDIDFLYWCPSAPLGSGGGNVGLQVGAPNPNPQPGSYSNSGQQNMKGLVNSSGYTNGVGNNCFNINNYDNCNFDRQNSKK